MRYKVYQRYMASLLVVPLVAVLGALLLPGKVYAATFTVTNANASGAGSLAAAIQAANSNGNAGTQDIISFDIDSDGSGVKTITPSSALTITEPVLIDGYTQGDAEANTAEYPEPLNGTLRIELNLTDADGISITADNVTLQGLVINNAETGNIVLNGADDFKLLGSYIDVAPNGMLRKKSDDSSRSLVITNSNNVRIGGNAAEERNVFGYCRDNCIYGEGTGGQATDNLQIIGNNIGVGADSISGLPNERGGAGIELVAGVTNASIGNTQPGGGNAIQSNTHGAMTIQDVTGFELFGNRITFNHDWGINCNCPGNNGGILLEGVTDATIGADSSLGRNIIAGNSKSLTLRDSSNGPTSNVTITGNYIGVIEDGTTAYPNEYHNILIEDNTEYVLITKNIIKNAYDIWAASPWIDGISFHDNAQSVAIIENSIFGNEDMGIDLFDNGPTPNDSDDADAGPNGLLNYPEYYEVTESGGNTTIKYTLEVPAGEYRIDFYKNSAADIPGPGEGEVFLGSTTITAANTDVGDYEHTVSGTGHNNLSLTATLIDDNSPTGYGPTSEFGGAGDPPAPVIDMAVKKKLLNPEDVALGSVLNYEITLTNYGPDPVDMSNYDNSIPTVNSAFIDLLPPQLGYVSVATAGFSCVQGPSAGDVYGPAVANHAGYGIIACGYTNGSHELAAGESISATIQLEVVDDSNLEFTNFIFGGINNFDPDIEAMGEVFSSGDDMIDLYMTTSPVNNFSYAHSVVADMDITKTLKNPEDVAPGATLQYDITITNNGPHSADLSYFNGGGDNPVATALFVDALPPNLTYVSQSNQDISCPITVPANVTPYFTNHNDHTVILCVYAGASSELASGESITTTLTAELTGEIGSGFTNNAFLSLPMFDPDRQDLYMALYRGAISQQDFLDIMNDNQGVGLALASYSVPQPEPDNGGSGNNGGSGSNPIANGISTLATTGQGKLMLGLAAGVLIVASALVLKRSGITVRRKNEL